MTETWRTRAPRSLIDPLDSRGQPVATPTDRRWLWRLEGFLAVNGTNDLQRQMGSDLRAYLNETCEHHWIHLPADDCCEAARQCTWCHWTEWQTADGWAA